MARRRTGRKSGRGKTVIRTGFTPTFPLKGGGARMARRRSNKGRH